MSVHVYALNHPLKQLDLFLEASAAALQSVLHDAEVQAQFDSRTDKHLLRISRRHHGNVKSSAIMQDFVHGADYEALSTAGRTFKGLVGEAAVVNGGTLSLDFGRRSFATALALASATAGEAQPARCCGTSDR